MRAAADVPAVADRPAERPQRPGGPGGWRSAWPVMAWAAGLVVAAVVLFWCYLRLSQTTAVNSDGSGTALQGWDMLHGNLLLSGWWLADVTFYTFEVPVDALVEAVHGLNPDVVHISAALIYMLLVLTAALVARGTARGAEGIARALIAGGVLVAPAISPGTHVLLLSPDHTGIGVPILLTLLFMDRARERWWAALVVCVLLIWAQVDDPLATFAAAVPVTLVCLGRAAVVGLRRREAAAYDIMLGLAAAASYELTNIAIKAIHSAGGYAMQPLSSVGKLTPYADWARQIVAAVKNVLILFGADFYEQPAGVRTWIAFLHFAGLALAVVGVLAGIVGLARGWDRVTQILTVGTLVTLAAGTLGTQMVAISGAHEIAVVLPFGAVLAGRAVGPWLVSRRLPRRALTPVLGLVLAGYLAALGYSVALPARPAETQGLADWLTAHHLTSGLGRYWSASSTTLASGGQVRVIAMQRAAKVAYPWVTKPSWYDPAQSYANFVVAAPGNGNAYAFPEAAVRHSFGKPAREYTYGQYIIMVYNKNLLSQVPKPNQSQVDGH